MKTKTKAYLKIVAVAAISSTLIFSGCESTADGRTTQAQGAGIGALGGALLGGIIGYSVGGSDSALAGAAIGGAVGGLSGFAYGTHVAGKKSQYANTERYLDACIAAAIEKNNRAIAYNRSLSARIAQLEARAQVAIANNDAAQKAEIQAAIANLKDQTKSQIQEINKEIIIQRQVLQTEAKTNSSRLGSIRQQISNLESTKAESERELSRLASLDNRLDA